MIILLINGPNLGILGRREPDIYGNQTYSELMDVINKSAEHHGIILKSFQTNHEGKIIDILEENYETSDGLIINPGALAHTSVALMDAVKAYGKPAVEVHLTNPAKREDFRRRNYLSSVCEKTFAGMGHESYIQAIIYFARRNEEVTDA